VTAVVSRHRVLAPVALSVALIATVVITGVLSPLIVRVLHAAGVPDASLAEVTLRTLQLTAIALTFTLLTVLGGGGRRAWGLPPRDRLGLRVGVGFALGVASVLPVCALLFALEVRLTRVDVDPNLSWWLWVVSRAALAAVVIALMEELWFRGGLFTVLERSGGPVLALWLGAGVYAAAHFLDLPEEHAAPDGNLAGFIVLGDAIASVFQWRNVDSFLALLVAGLALGLVRLRDGHVALCIGIHAGWVLTIKVFKKYTFIEPDSPLSALAGAYDGVIGWAAVVSLALLLLGVWVFVNPRGKEIR